MPLPLSGSTWPPPALEPVRRDVEAWSAWWSGSPDALARVYGGQSTTESGFTARGGVVGLVRRWFWGQTPPSGEQQTKLHMPIAGEIPRINADLLFGQPPTITVAESAGDAAATAVTQERIDALLGERAHAQLHEAAEACSALGHVYIKGGWDRDIDSTGPIMSTVDADAAWPTYRHGRLAEALFVREWAEPGAVLRHFELHEPGMVWHAAYLGDHSSIGRIVDLGAHPQTEGLIVDGMVSDDTRAGSGIVTGIDRLDVVGVPNARSHTWRNLPAARYLGRADIAGVEPVLDALDDVWSSLMRDVRHGRSRIHVPQHYLDSLGKGQGATFDMLREIYVPFNAPLDTTNLQIDAQQFNIRHVEHLAIVTALLERVAGGAGLDPQTLGMAGDVAITATESWAKQIRSQGTRRSKIRYWRPELDDLTGILLDLDRAQFGGKADPDLARLITFPDTVSESPLANAQTVMALDAAGAISTQTKVEMAQAGWDDAAIQAEVERIVAERGTAPEPLGMFEQLPRTQDRGPAEDPPQ